MPMPSTESSLSKQFNAKCLWHSIETIYCMAKFLVEILTVPFQNSSKWKLCPMIGNIIVTVWCSRNLGFPVPISSNCSVRKEKLWMMNGGSARGTMSILTTTFTVPKFPLLPFLSWKLTCFMLRRIIKGQLGGHPKPGRTDRGWTKPETKSNAVLVAVLVTSTRHAKLHLLSFGTKIITTRRSHRPKTFLVLISINYSRKLIYWIIDFLLKQS